MTSFTQDINKHASLDHILSELIDKEIIADLEYWLTVVR